MADTNKYLIISLYVYNAILAALSIAVTVVGLMMLLYMEKYAYVPLYLQFNCAGSLAIFDQMDLNVERHSVYFAVALFVGVGLLTLTIAVAGILATFYKNTSILVLCTVCLYILICIQVGVVCVVKTQEGPYKSYLWELTEQLHENYNTDEDCKEDLDSIQKNLRCCEFNSGLELDELPLKTTTPEEGDSSSPGGEQPSIPESCCKDPKKCNETGHWTKTCSDSMWKWSSKMMFAIFLTGIVHSVILVIGFIGLTVTGLKSVK